MAFLKYEFIVRKSDIRFYEVSESSEKVIGDLTDQLKHRNDPLSALLLGVDDGWEVCLLKFMIDVITASSQGNLDDFRKRGFLN